MNRGEGRVLVLGGGLAGLSTAYHLEDHRPVVLLEKEDRLGGLTRSFRVNDFIFDITGHLLHLRRKEVRDLIDGLLPEGLASVKRRSFIHSHGVDVDYPFQANLHGLPPEVIRDCLTGFIEAHADPQRPGEEELAGASFHDWAEATFGRGIAAEFMLPYNRKLWCRDLRKITADWGVVGGSPAQGGRSGGRRTGNCQSWAGLQPDLSLSGGRRHRGPAQRPG